jgi:hypothetical protein
MTKEGDVIGKTESGNPIKKVGKTEDGDVIGKTESGNRFKKVGETEDGKSILVEKDENNRTRSGGSGGKILAFLSMTFVGLFPGAVLFMILTSAFQITGNVSTILLIILVPLPAILFVTIDTIGDSKNYEYIQNVLLEGLVGGLIALAAGIIIVPILYIGIGIISQLVGVSELLNGYGYTTVRGFSTVYLIWLVIGCLSGFALAIGESD